MAAKALVKATGSLGEADAEVAGHEIKVTLPKDIVDITLFLDLLDYILPAGMTCRIIRKNKNTKKIDDIKVMYSDAPRPFLTDDLVWEDLKGAVPNGGLSGLFAEGQSIVDFTTAYTKELNNELVINAGLLDSTIIPVLADSRIVEKDETSDIVELYSSDGKKLHGLKDNESNEALVLKAYKPIKEL
jgi:hypothetical protein